DRSNRAQAVRSTSGTQMTLRTQRATEIVQRAPASATAASEIVWRKTGATAPVASNDTSALIARATASPAAVMRAPDSSSGSSASSVALPETAIGRTRTPDAAQLIDQVTRRLYRQMAAERERRGGGSRWP